ncbi:MAG: ABC transporter permease [Peptococcaceae bacterium]|jgi:simple sugar transport system permease protein|nr:ABC transporter permease [Peptococcaceae bacterium]
MRISLGKTRGKIVGAVVMVAAALLIGAVLMLLSGNNPLEAYRALVFGAFSSRQRVSELFVKLVPVMIMGLGVSVAYRAQLWNIGAGGQFLLGAIAATAVGLYVKLPPALLAPLTILAAAAAGGGWALLAGLLKVKFHANEVITTLMLNYIANYFLKFLVYGPMMDPAGQLPQSALLPEGIRLRQIFPGLRANYGLIIMVVALILTALLWRSAVGCRINLIGQGERVATYGGVNVRRVVLLTMFISGGAAGVAGWIETFGLQYRLMENMAGSYGDIATVVALLGALNPYGIAAASVFFAILLVGGAGMQRMTNVPYSIVDVIQGLIIIFVIAGVVGREGRPGKRPGKQSSKLSSKQPSKLSSKEPGRRERDA